MFNIAFELNRVKWVNLTTNFNWTFTQNVLLYLINIKHLFPKHIWNAIIVYIHTYTQYVICNICSKLLWVKGKGQCFFVMESSRVQWASPILTLFYLYILFLFYRISILPTPSRWVLKKEGARWIARRGACRSAHVNPEGPPWYSLSAAEMRFIAWPRVRV